MKKRMISLALVSILSAIGIYTSLHLVQLHYSKPKHQLNLINTLQFMEKWYPRYQVEEEVEKQNNLSDANTVNPFDSSDFNPYDAAMNAPAAPEKFVPQTGCDISEHFGCTRPDDSKYSEIAGLAVSVYGIIGYILLIGLVIIHAARRISRSDVFVFMLWVGAWLGILFSIYLTVVEAFFIKSFCPYCLVSAAVMLGIFICMIAGFGFEPLRMFLRGEIFPTSLFIKKKQS
ncbi:MAG TPA: vitamin K epoxide reductase family protein [bacterium]|nr:vitamin K epoxide reductase family protein [bacterium]